MAGLDVDEVTVGANGKVYIAPVGTAAPGDPIIAPAAAWVDLGYTSEEGVGLNKGREVASIRAWQSFFDIRKIVTGESLRLTWQLQQWNDANVVLAFGGGAVTTVAAAAGPPALIQHYRYEPPLAGDLDERAGMVEWADGDKHYRLIVPRGMVGDAVETNLTKNAESRLPIAFDVLGTDGAVPWYLITDDPALNPAA